MRLKDIQSQQLIRIVFVAFKCSRMRTIGLVIGFIIRMLIREKKDLMATEGKWECRTAPHLATSGNGMTTLTRAINNIQRSDEHATPISEWDSAAMAAMAAVNYWFNNNFILNKIMYSS